MDERFIVPAGSAEVERALEDLEAAQAEARSAGRPTDRLETISERLRTLQDGANAESDVPGNPAGGRASDDAAEGPDTGGSDNHAAWNDDLARPDNAVAPGAAADEATGGDVPVPLEHVMAARASGNDSEERQREPIGPEAAGAMGGRSAAEAPLDQEERANQARERRAPEFSDAADEAGRPSPMPPAELRLIADRLRENGDLTIGLLQELLGIVEEHNRRLAVVEQQIATGRLV